MDPGDDFRRQMALEKCRGVLGLGENGFEKTVVRVRGGDEIRFFYRAEIRSTLRQRQGSFPHPGFGGRAVARKSSMSDGHWRFKKKLNIRPCFGNFSLPWKH